MSSYGSQMEQQLSIDGGEGGGGEWMDGGNTDSPTLLLLQGEEKRMKRIYKYSFLFREGRSTKLFSCLFSLQCSNIFGGISEKVNRCYSVSQSVL